MASSTPVMRAPADRVLGDTHNGQQCAGQEVLGPGWLVCCTAILGFLGFLYTSEFHAPSDIGKVDLTWLTLSSWRTTLLRSPIDSALPSREVNFRCWTASRGTKSVSRDRVGNGRVGRVRGKIFTDGPERLLRGGPRAARLLQAHVVERGLDRDDQVALERVIGRGDAVVVALGEAGVGGLRGLDGRGGVGERDGGSLLGANGHCSARGGRGLWESF